MRRLGIGSALALMGIVALVAGGIALATQGDDTTVSQVAREGDNKDEEGSMRDWPFDRPSAKQIRAKREEFAKALGEELDKSTDEVLEAFENVFEKRLDKAVEEGDLTRKQADRIFECYESAGSECSPPFGARRGFRFGPHRGFRGGPHDFRGGPPGFHGGGPPPFFGGGGPPGI